MSALGPIEILFLLAPLAAVPLAMRLTAVPTEATAGPVDGAPAAAVGGSGRGRIVPPAARASGRPVLAGVWLAVTALVAVHGTGSRLLGSARTAAEIAVSAGGLMLPSAA